MKTIEQAAKEYVQSLNYYPDMGQGEILKNGFKKGVEFSQKWIPCEEDLPLCYESGNWDGLRSEFVIAKLSNGNWHKARLYSGILDGSKFNG